VPTGNNQAILVVAPALVTADQLPGSMSGRGLARRARRLHPDLCVLVTSTALDDASQELYHHGDTRFASTKQPHPASDMVRVLAAVLTRDTFSVETEQLLAR